MADAFDQFETLLRENISSAVVDLVLEDDDPAWALIDVLKPESMGGRRTSTDAAPGTIASGDAGYEASWRVKVQRGGRAVAGSFAGNTMTATGADDHLFVGQAADALYLDPTLTPLPSWITIRMMLKRIRGSVTVNRQQILARLASEPIDQVAGDHIADAVARLRSYLTNMFWTDGTGSLAQLNADPSSQPAEGTQQVVTLKNGQFARFAKGDMLVAGSDASPRILRTGGGGDGATGRLMVVDVDREQRQISVEPRPGVGTFTALAEDDHLMYDDTYDFTAASDAAATRKLPNGVEALLINTGDFPGTELDVTNYTDLKSFVSGDESNKDDPTPESIALILDKIADAGYAPPEALFMERSGWTLYGQLEREAGAQYVVPQGAAFVASGGVDGPVIQHMQNRFQRFSSIRMRPGSLVGLAPDTWRKFMPLGSKTVHWVYSSGPLAGTNSIFGPVYEGHQLTELADAPFDSFCEFSCDKPQRNFRRIGYRVQRDV